MTEEKAPEAVAPVAPAPEARKAETPATEEKEKKGFFSSLFGGKN